MNQIFLMAERDIHSLRHEIKLQQQIGRPRAMMADSSYRSHQGTMQVLRIHGPVLSRPSWLSQLLGLRSTEEHLDNLSSMLATGDPILLDVDSVGGDANLAFEFADMIRSGGDRVTAYSGGYAASAGMLFLTAASKSFAHRSATLGAIGVVGFCNFADDPNAVYSDNANNKRPNKESVLRDINATEQFFLEYVSQGTGLSQQQVVSLGNEGDIFSGQSAAANGFVTGNTTLADLTAGKPDQQTQLMAAFVAKQLTINPDIKVEEMLANYLSIYPNAGTTPATAKKQKSDDDWEARLQFMRDHSRRQAGLPVDDDRPRQRPQHRTQSPQQQTSGGVWESRLSFIRQYARGANA